MDFQQPTQTFSVDLAKGLVELLMHSRGVAGSLASARTEANTAADKYEAILRELRANTAVVVDLGTENKALTEVVIELKKVVEGGTPEARAQTEDEITQCRSAYAATLVQLVAKAATTADVWKGQADTTAVVQRKPDGLRCHSRPAVCHGCYHGRPLEGTGRYLRCGSLDHCQDVGAVAQRSGGAGERDEGDHEGGQNRGQLALCAQDLPYRQGL